MLHRFKPIRSVGHPWRVLQKPHYHLLPLLLLFPYRSIDQLMHVLTTTQPTTTSQKLYRHTENRITQQLYIYRAPRFIDHHQSLSAYRCYIPPPYHLLLLLSWLLFVHVRIFIQVVSISTQLLIASRSALSVYILYTCASTSYNNNVNNATIANDTHQPCPYSDLAINQNHTVQSKSLACRFH